MSDTSAIENVAALAAKAAMGVDSDKSIIDMCGTDMGNITTVIVELIRWDAARLAAEAAESRKKPVPR